MFTFTDVIGSSSSELMKLIVKVCSKKTTVKMINNQISSVLAPQGK
jgi:hypothetical protein